MVYVQALALEHAKALAQLDSRLEAGGGWGFINLWASVINGSQGKFCILLVLSPTIMVQVKTFFAFSVYLLTCASLICLL